jgi:simple sugar transport system ATP-binding protein
MGENGAGKSTLIKVLTGVERQEQGEITLEGRLILARSPQHAQELGISTVYQEVNLCPNLSVAENIYLGREPRGLFGINWRLMNAQAAQALQRMDVHIDVTQRLDAYPIAIQQMAAIARALSVQAKVLILDEPTSSLDVNEVEKLFEVIRKLKAQGLGIIFITHFIDQVYAIADRITVLRNGELVGTFEVENLPRIELVSKMIGKELATLDGLARRRDEETHSGKDVLLSAEGLAQHGAVKSFDMQLHAGELLGLAGLLGSGRTEVARLLFGAEKPDQGRLRIGGQEVHSYSPQASLLRGVGLCPENRKADGIIEDLTVRENIILALQASQGWFKFLDARRQSEIAEQYIHTLGISTPSAEQLVKNLSGGNQQKVILARWLATNPSILILDEPTRGIDVGAKAEIQKIMLNLVEEGKGVIFISSELEEVIRCSNRVVVMRDRQKVGELTGKDIAEDNIMQTIAAEISVTTPTSLAEPAAEWSRR